MKKTQFFKIDHEAARKAMIDANSKFGAWKRSHADMPGKTEDDLGEQGALAKKIIDKGQVLAREKEIFNALITEADVKALREKIRNPLRELRALKFDEKKEFHAAMCAKVLQSLMPTKHGK